MKAGSPRDARAHLAVVLLIASACSVSVACPSTDVSPLVPQESAVVQAGANTFQIAIEVGRGDFMGGPGLRVPDLPFLDRPAGVIVQIVDVQGGIDAIAVTCIRVSAAGRGIDLVPHEQSRSDPPRAQLRIGASDRMPWRGGDRVTVQIWLMVEDREYSVMTQEIMQGR